MSSLKFKTSRLALALLAAGVLGGAGVTAVRDLSTPAFALTAPVAAAQAANATITAPNFAAIAAREGPAVVNISVSGMRKTGADDGDNSPAARQRGPQGMDPNDPFNEFFRRFGIPMPERGGQGQRGMPMRGEGSGFIIDANGIVLTNAHVVKGATDVTVKLTDRREFRAKVLGSDPKTDVAVLKIDAKNLPTVRLGSTCTRQHKPGHSEKTRK